MIFGKDTFQSRTERPGLRVSFRVVEQGCPGPRLRCPRHAGRTTVCRCGIRTGSLGAGSVGVGVGLGSTTGLGIVSGISMGSEPGYDRESRATSLIEQAGLPD